MDFIYVFKKHWILAKGEKFKIITYIALHILSVVAITAQPITFAMVINTLQANNEDMLKNVMWWLFAYVACFYIFEICHRFARGIELGVAYGNKKRFVLNSYLILQAMPLSWHMKHHSGNVISRINKASDSLFKFGQSLYEYITAIVRFIVSVLVLWIISPVIAIVSTVAGCLLILITRQFYNKSIPEYRKLNEGFHNIAGTMQDGVSNITTIIILRLGKCIYKDIEKQFDANFLHLKTDNWYTQGKCHFNSLIEIVLNVAMIFYYIITATKGGDAIMLGSITAIFQYLSQIMQSFWFYGSDYESCIHWKNDLDAVDDIFHCKENTQPTFEMDKALNWSKIKISGISYKFEERLALEDISIKLEPGKRIAFVGESGSGKSTLLKIIRGIYPVNDCSIEVDKDGCNHSIAELSGITTLIPQEPEMFDDSVLYNISMGLDCSNEEIQEVMYLSGFDEVLSKLPKGLMSMISEDGVNMSGGEKQRLALARGVFSIKDSSIILLDEPTTSLDAETEFKIYQRMFAKYPDKCIVSVLHRLHLLHLFDYIYVFKDGHIVEQGTLEQLVDMNSYFGDLWSRYMQTTE